jgi:hypothetical protein
MQLRSLTNEQHKSIRRGFGRLRWALDTKELHARDNRADEVNVENGQDINQMKSNSNGHEANATRAGHGEAIGNPKHLIVDIDGPDIWR